LLLRAFDDGRATGKKNYAAQSGDPAFHGRAPRSWPLVMVVDYREFN
jgi:hypothetical protein